MYVPTIGEHVNVPVYKGTMVLEVTGLKLDVFYGSPSYWVVGRVLKDTRPKQWAREVGDISTVSITQLEQNR